jgi:hypothetical protein
VVQGVSGLLSLRQVSMWNGGTGKGVADAHGIVVDMLMCSGASSVERELRFEGSGGAWVAGIGCLGNGFSVLFFSVWMS